MVNKNKLKFLVIGLGSMGRRRIRNLLHHGLKPANIFGFNLSKDRCLSVGQEFGIQTENNFKKAVKKFNPDVFIISTPPDTHSRYFLYAARQKKHFFVEHPTTDKGYSELLKLQTKNYLPHRQANKIKTSPVGVPSGSWRFNPAVKKIKNLIEKGAIGKVLAFQYHLGQYLPDWHPWEDYRQVYFSKKSTGACREMFAFELGWLTFVLNLSRIKSVSGAVRKLSDLEMDADDFYSANLNFENKVQGTMVIDLLTRKPFRTLRVIGSTGVLEWEWLDYTIKIHTSRNDSKLIRLNKGRNEKQYVTTEDMYEEEIGRFLKTVQGKEKYPFSFEENHHFLKALFALEKSSKVGKIIKI